MLTDDLKMMRLKYFTYIKENMILKQTAAMCISLILQNLYSEMLKETMRPLNISFVVI